jgi:hypothetical protein
VSAAERLERWRTPSVAVQLRRPTLSVAAADDLQPLLADVSLVNATVDAWQAVRDQLGVAPVRVVESWEVSS